MATKKDIKNTLYDALVTIVSNTTSVSTPENHVDVLQHRSEDRPFPFVSFEAFGSPHNRGFDGNIHVANEVYSSGEIDYVQYRRDTRLNVDIAVEMDGGDAQAKDDLYTAVQDHFSTYVARTKPENFHSDVYEITDEGFDDESDRSNNIMGDRQSYMIGYKRYFRVDDYVPMREISVSIEDLDSTTIYDSDTITS